MATDRRAARRIPGASFTKLLGTGSGRTFTVGDADLHHWGLLTVWSSRSAMQSFESSALSARWRRRSQETLQVRLTPLASTGRWSGREPFGTPSAAATDGPVAALTRARLKPTLARRFWASVPPVVEALHRQNGLVLAVGVGEAPLGLQGTFSIWRSAGDLSTFAYRDPHHRQVIEQTRASGWYAEELFARFAVESVSGTFDGNPVTP